MQGMVSHGRMLAMLMTTEQFIDKYPAFSMRYLRRLLHERDTNGLANAVISISQRRLLIDEERFMEWVEAKRGGDAE